MDIDLVLAMQSAGRGALNDVPRTTSLPGGGGTVHARRPETATTIRGNDPVETTATDVPLDGIHVLQAVHGHLIHIHILNGNGARLLPLKSGPNALVVLHPRNPLNAKTNIVPSPKLNPPTGVTLRN